MHTSSTVSVAPSTATKPPVALAPTPSPKRAASRPAPGTRAFIRQMAENLRTHDPEGSSEGAGVAADPDEAKAAGAQARGIEAEQARMRDESVGERYQAVLQTYLQVNTQRIERIENRLETLIENQQAALGELNAQRSGFLASSANTAEWSAGVEAA